MNKLVLLFSLALVAAGCAPSQPAQNQADVSALGQQSGQESAAGQQAYSLAEVQVANSQAKCWSAVNGKVYDLTEWINKHPGGSKAILQICGKDGSELFNKQHGGQAKAEAALKSLLLGDLK